MINNRIEKALSIINEAKINSNKKKSTSKNKRMVSIKKCSYQYINNNIDVRNYRSVINNFIDSYKKGFCTSLCIKKIKPLTEDKLNYIMDQGLMLDDYSIRFP